MKKTTYIMIGLLLAGMLLAGGVSLWVPLLMSERGNDVLVLTCPEAIYDIHRAYLDAGADIIAFDATLRKRENPLEEMIFAVHDAGRLAMADISTLEEGINAANLGADIISTTLAGYTDQSGEPTKGPDFELLEKLVQSVSAPVILEGRVWEPKDVNKAFELGAHCVVIGSAITRPQLITKRFLEGR